MVFEGEPHVWMINPEFLKKTGSSYPLGEPITRSVRANMYVISPQARPLLRSIVCVGRRVRMVEGTYPGCDWRSDRNQKPPTGLGRV